MVHHQRYHQLKKGVEIYVAEDDEESNAICLLCGNTGYNKRTRPKLFSLFFLTLLSCSLILAPQFFTFPPTSSLLYGDHAVGMDVNESLCSSAPIGVICCDRSSIRSDICKMEGDVRTHPASSSIFLYNQKNTSDFIDHVSGLSNDGKEEDEEEIQHKKIRPYTRKWEASTMNTVDELNLISRSGILGTGHHCDVHHDVPAVFFSTGGYTGNVYHEFNDGILPLYITSQHLNKKVVFVISDYHDWWYSKYSEIVSCLSGYPPIDFHGDNRTHCFPEAVVGLKIHDELTVDPSLMEGNKTIKDFRGLLDRAYCPRIKDLVRDEEREARLNRNNSPAETLKELQELKRPKLVIISRNGSRTITNEDLLVNMAEQIGFRVEILRPNPTSELVKIYRALNSSDVMIGVHGAAMTHFLFMRPGSVFLQVIPLGTTWAAETYFGEPAVKLGLRYIGYEILPQESSLYEEYDKNDPVLKDPNSVNDKGWEFTKKIYLDGQNVMLNLERFGKRLVRAYQYSAVRKNHNFHHHSRYF